MDEEHAWRRLAEERRSFADLLAGLDESRWTTPSLCEGWDVAEVATHVMVGPTSSLRDFAVAMLKARGRFAEANRVLVDRRMHRPRSAVVADLRDGADSRFRPPGMDWRAPVTDLLVHRLDVIVPLGLDAPRAADLWPEALGLLVGPEGRKAFIGKGLPTLTFVATDVDWRHGDGPVVEGPAEALALAVTRRPTPRLDDLAGPGAAALRGWARRE